MSRSREIVVLGIDPGPQYSGWALVSVPLGKPGTLIKGSHDLPGVVVEMIQLADQVVIERPEGKIYDKKRSYGLFPTAEMAGWLRAHVEIAGKPLIMLGAEAWRLGLIGKKSPGDKEIRSVLGMLVPGCTGNSHVMDAIGIAMAGARGVAVR
jgi:Holliday junction resolvasome RuvABC endonuclease subunit